MFKLKAALLATFLLYSQAMYCMQAPDNPQDDITAGMELIDNSSKWGNFCNSYSNVIVAYISSNLEFGNDFRIPQLPFKYGYLKTTAIDDFWNMLRFVRENAENMTLLLTTQDFRYLSAQDAHLAHCFKIKIVNLENSKLYIRPTTLKEKQKLIQATLANETLLAGHDPCFEPASIGNSTPISKKKLSLEIVTRTMPFEEKCALGKMLLPENLWILLKPLSPENKKRFLYNVLPELHQLHLGNIDPNSPISLLPKGVIGIICLLIVDSELQKIVEETCLN